MGQEQDEICLGTLSAVTEFPALNRAMTGAKAEDTARKLLQDELPGFAVTANHRARYFLAVKLSSFQCVKVRLDDNSERAIVAVSLRFLAYDVMEQREVRHGEKIRVMWATQLCLRFMPCGRGRRCPMPSLMWIYPDMSRLTRRRYQDFTHGSR
jgi:hypothetical protein